MAPNCKTKFWYGVNDTFYDVVHTLTITTKQLKLRDTVRVSLRCLSQFVRDKYAQSTIIQSFVYIWYNDLFIN